MNRNKLMEQGYTWEEAEDKLSQCAEEQADTERDRQMEDRLSEEKKNE
jgi:hypothetical protein